MVFTGVKTAGAANSMQIGEIQFFGDKVGGSALLSPADSVLAIDLDGDSDPTPATRGPPKHRRHI